MLRVAGRKRTEAARGGPPAGPGNSEAEPDCRLTRAGRGDRQPPGWDGAGAPGGPPKAEPGAGSAGPGAAQRRCLIRIAKTALSARLGEVLLEAGRGTMRSSHDLPLTLYHQRRRKPHQTDAALRRRGGHWSSPASKLRCELVLSPTVYDRKLVPGPAIQ
jgi:hypothetical protein